MMEIVTHAFILFILTAPVSSFLAVESVPIQWIIIVQLWIAALYVLGVNTWIY